MNNSIGEACVEILEIIKYLDPAIIDKIPKDFIDDLNQYKSDDYSFSYDITKNLNEQNIKNETKGYIAYIYKYFLCDEQKRIEYKENCKRYYYQLECEKKDKYKDLDIFKESREKKNKWLSEAEKNKNALIEIENSNKTFFDKILIKLKAFIKNIKGGKNA